MFGNGGDRLQNGQQTIHIRIGFLNLILPHLLCIFRSETNPDNDGKLVEGMHRPHPLLLAILYVVQSLFL